MSSVERSISSKLPVDLAPQNGDGQVNILAEIPTIIWQNRQDVGENKVPEGFVPRKKLLEILGISSSGWYWVKKHHDISTVRIGKLRYYCEEDVESIKEQRAQIRRRRGFNRLKFGNGSGDGAREMSAVDIHFREIKKIPIAIEKHEIWGAQIFTGQLALFGLSEIANSNLVTTRQQEQIAQILESGRPKFLLDQFNSAVTERKKRIATGKARKADIEFVETSQRYKTWILSKLAAIAENDSRQVCEQQLQALIDTRIRRVTKGVEAYEKLVNSNLRLAATFSNGRWKNFPFEDRLSFAEEGLMIVAARWDFRQGFRFATYAGWWIRQLIARGMVNSGSMIRVPLHLDEEIEGLIRRQQQMVQESGEEIDFEKLVENSNRRREIRQAIDAKTILSLNSPIGSKQTTELGQLIADEKDDAGEAIKRMAQKQAVRSILAELSPKERKVLTLRFGLEDGRERTLEEVGREFNVTRERIRQIEVRALKKLRKSETARELLLDLTEA